MLDWIFGSSKSEKKQQVNSEDKLSQDEAWVYDFIRQYLLSPIWKNPLLDFIQQNCPAFQDTQENKFQYTKIFQQFTSLCSILIESIVEETGITFKTLEKCIIKGLKSNQDKKIFTQILICDNFLMFKRIMISKNKELQVQALQQMRKQNKKQDKVQDQIDQAQRQRLEIQQAIAMSLALQQKAKQQQEQQFQQAIRQSQAMAKEQEIKKVQKMQSPKKQQKQQVKQEQKKQKRELLGKLPPLIIPEKKFDSQTDFVQQKQKIFKRIQELKKDHKEQQDSQQRKQRLIEQRQLLKKKKQQERKAQLKTFVENKQGISSGNNNKITQQELARRKKLINRLKDQLKSD